MWQMVFTGQKTQPTVSKYWRNTKSTHITQKYNKHTYKHKNTANPLVYNGVTTGWLPQRAGSPSLNGGGTAISLENINSSSSQDNNKRHVRQQHPVQRFHTEKYRRADKLQRHTTDLNREKVTMQNREAKLPWFSRLLWQSGNKVDLFYNAPEPTCG